MRHLGGLLPYLQLYFYPCVNSLLITKYITMYFAGYCRVWYDNQYLNPRPPFGLVYGREISHVVAYMPGDGRRMHVLPKLTLRQMSTLGKMVE